MNILHKSILLLIGFCVGSMTGQKISEHKGPLAEKTIAKQSTFDVRKEKEKAEKPESVIPLFRQTAEKIKSIIAEKEEISPAAFPEQKPIIIEKNAGQKFVIELPTNLSTGYMWYWLINDPLKARPVELIKKEFIAKSVGAIGCDGFVRFTFKAMKVGTMTLVLYNKRLWEKNSDKEIRRYQVTVHYKRHCVKQKPLLKEPCCPLCCFD